MGDETDQEIEHLKTMLGVAVKHIAELQAWKNEAKPAVDNLTDRLGELADYKGVKKLIAEASESTRIKAVEDRVTKVEAKTKNLK